MININYKGPEPDDEMQFEQNKPTTKKQMKKTRTKEEIEMV